MAQSHQGKVQVTNLADGGACFTLCLPIFNASQSQHQAIEPAQQAFAPIPRTQPQQYFADAAGS